MLKSTLPNWTNDFVMLNSKQVNGFQTKAVRLIGKLAEPSGGQTKQYWTRGCPQHYSTVLNWQKTHLYDNGSFYPTIILYWVYMKDKFDLK